MGIRANVSTSAGVIAIALALISGCGSEASTPTAPSRVAVTPISSIPLHLREVDHLALGNGWAAFAYIPLGEARDANPSEVAVLDLKNRSLRTVGRSRWLHGVIDWVEATGGWIFWTDAQREATDSANAGSWRIIAMNVATGHQSVVAHSTFSSPEPIPRAGVGRLVWFEQRAPDSPLVTIKAFNTATRSTRVLISGLEPPGSIWPGTTGPIWEAATTNGRSDLWTAPWTDQNAEAKTAEPLTTNGEASNLSVSPDGRTGAWDHGTIVGGSQGIAIGDPYRPSDAALDPDPGYRDGGNTFDGVRAGNGFAVYFDENNDALGLITAQTAHRPTLLAKGGVVYVPCRFATDGSYLAYCTQDQPGSPDITLVVVEIAQPNR